MSKAMKKPPPCYYDAIRDGESITFLYEGKEAKAIPLILGIDSRGNEVVFCLRIDSEDPIKTTPMFYDVMKTDIISKGSKISVKVALAKYKEKFFYIFISAPKK